MLQHRLKACFGLFFLLSGLFGFNLFVLQSSFLAVAAKRIVFPGGVAVRESGRAIPQNDNSALPPAPEPQLSLAVASAPLPVTTGSVSEPDLTRAVQRELQVHGYEAGGVDGVIGTTTRAAIMAFEWDTGMPLTGEPTQNILQALLLGSGRAGPAGSASAVQPSLQAVQVIRSVQQGLTALGYGEFKTAGNLSPDTQRAIRLFEVREGLAETGRISGHLVARVVRLSSEKRLADGR